MTIDPMTAWVVIRDGKVVHVRLTREMADASATIEKTVYGFENVKVVPVLLTPIEDVK